MDHEGAQTIHRRLGGQEFRSEMNSKFEQTQTTIDRLADTVDGFVKRLEDHEVEIKARDHQVEKLLVWARKVSERTGVPLENL